MEEKKEEKQVDAKQVLKPHLLKTAVLTDEEFDYVFSCFKPLSYKKGQTIIASGDKVDGEFFVLTGASYGKP